ncbi:hypothetical protein GH714_035826 [Hevea brasiliensis]|uniref:Transposase-associated domain-containing protein n=1 Tax=Hevea brasiliensis TaxID=3981 RepID=A0A6A6KM64_HEVBR|nr:hypothetical protein GH714_035826 [Hevea brasiliensis]
MDFAFAHTKVKGYTRWLYHGEFVAQENYNSIGEGQNCYDDMLGMIHDAAGPKIMKEIINDVDEKDHIKDNNIDVEYEAEPNKSPTPNEDASKFLKLLEDAR